MGPIGCLGRVVGLVALLALLGLAWLRAPEAWERVGGGSVERTTPAAGLAEATRTRLEAAIRAGDSVVLIDGDELTALYHAEAGSLIGAGILPGSVELGEGSGRVGVHLIPSAFVGDGWPDPVRRMLPPTVPITLEVAVLPGSPGEALLLVRGVRAAGIPVPRRAWGRLLPEVRDQARDTSPEELVRLPLPPVVEDLYIDEDVLHLVLRR